MNKFFTLWLSFELGKSEYLYLGLLERGPMVEKFPFPNFELTQLFLSPKPQSFLSQRKFLRSFIEVGSGNKENSKRIKMEKTPLIFDQDSKFEVVSTPNIITKGIDLAFEKISYEVKGKKILHGVSAEVGKGELMAIMVTRNHINDILGSNWSRKIDFA
jgi:hypothetical protein